MSEWISVKDRMPEKHKEYAVWIPDLLDYTIGGAAVAFWAGDYWRVNGIKYRDGITHWMPLPEPPKEKGQDDK